MYLTEEDRDFLDGSIKILSNARKLILDLPVKDAQTGLSQFDNKTQEKYSRKDGKDTLYCDMVAEEALTIGNDSLGVIPLFLKSFGQEGVIITEECGKIPRKLPIGNETPVVISDPIDGSSLLSDILRRNSQGDEPIRIGEAFEREKESGNYNKLRRHSPNSSITLLRDNMIKYTTILNLLTGDFYMGSCDGVFMGDVSDINSHEDFKRKVKFWNHEDLRMICYTRPKGKYEQNRMGTHLRFFSEMHPQSGDEIGPIGPMRFTYLVDFGGDDQPEVGVVAHNGEKIQESLPNITMARYSKGDLQGYKLFCDPEYTQHRAGKGMTPNLASSLYSDGLIHNTGIKLVFLNNYDYPSEFRDTTVIIPSGNDAALTMMTGMVEREYATRII